MTPLTLAQRVLAIDGALADIAHAFGGALALAYYAEPRATIDIDLNVFIVPTRVKEVTTPLGELGAVGDPIIAELVLRDGQARVMWEGTPINLFFAYDAFHGAAGVARRTVPFADSSIPILSPEHLMVCKVVFNRPRDWIDIDTMVSTGTEIRVAEVLRWVGRIAGDDDPRYERAVALLTRP